jgi:hypothetical protein
VHCNVAEDSIMASVQIVAGLRRVRRDASCSVEWWSWIGCLKMVNYMPSILDRITIAEVMYAT